MKLRSRTFAAILVALLLFPSGVAFGEEVQPLNPPPTPVAGEMVDETPQLWFVELTGLPVAAGGDRKAVQNEHKAFRSAAAAAGIQFRERFAFDTLWNGLSISVSPRYLKDLRKLPGVKAIYPVRKIEVPETEKVSPDLATALAMTGADVAQNELGLTGAGIRVAVMDTGIDYHHPDLGGCFGPGCRVEVGWDFVGDEFNADPDSPSYNPVPEPDPDPDDCNGHGTHVAGIIGANGEVTGVAPGVTFGAYKVFGCDGSTTTDIMIAAMEMALADGMDVLNMSIGSPFAWPQDPSAVAADHLVDQGVVVVASIGNSGASGVYSAGAPGVGDEVIGVASFDNTHISALSFQVNPSGRQVAYLPLADTDDPPTEGTTPEVVFVGRGCLADQYLADPNGKVALIERGACTFEEKYQRAVAAGAVAVVIHNNVPGLFAGGGVNGAPGVPGVGISRDDGVHIRSLLESGPVTLTWTADRIEAPNPTGGLISSFSSYGPAADLSLKPDIGAPGGLIRSTYPLERGGYAIISGTSMSSPHVAGAVALLLEARPGIDPETVGTLLRNTANPAVWWGNPGLGLLDNVHRQGAGMLDIPGAVLATTRVEPAKISLGETGGRPVRVTLTIRNDGDQPVTYTLHNEDALATRGDAFAPGFWFEPAGVTFDTTTVTVKARGQAKVKVEIAAPAELPEGGVYGGYLVVTSQADGNEYRVPYAGFKGDYQALPILTPIPGADLPWLARLEDGDFAKQEDGAVFTMEGDDIPFVLVHLHHQSRFLRVEVRTPDGRTWGEPYDLELLPRNDLPTGFFALPWDGLVPRGNSGKLEAVPDGEYVLILMVGKALTHGNNPAAVEIWTSPVFRIERPDAGGGGGNAGE